MSANHAAYTDQYRAAVADVEQMLTRAAQNGGTRPRRITGNPWLGQHLDALSRSMRRGTVRLCPHIGASPRVAHAAVWAPGRLVCTACLPTLRPDDAEDRRCDRCRRSGPMYAGAVGVGPVLLTYGLCRTCVRRTGLANLDHDVA